MLRTIAVASAAAAAVMAKVVVEEFGQSGSACSYNFGNSTFNVAPLRISTFYYVNDDRNNAGSLNYTYFFNICDNTGLIPNPNVCNTTFPGTGGGFTPLSGPAPAFQLANIPVVNPTVDTCHRLGGPVSSQTLSWGLYDPTNPSRGVYLQYTGGDACPNTLVSRSLRVWLLCYNDAVNIPDEEMVLESGSCLYDIFINSAFGCPAECPMPQDPNTGERMLCSNHGVCDYDSAIGNSRCFCNPGWEGKDCGSVAQPAAKGLSAAAGVLIGVSIFLALVLAFMVFLWMRIRALRLDPSAYSALRGEPMQGGGDSVAIQ